MTAKQLESIYDKLHAAYGWQNWWPMVRNGRAVYLDEYRTRPRTDAELFEIAVGAILTQNTAWSNVVKAVSALKSEKLLSLPGLRSAPLEKLAAVVVPAGYYNQKAKKLKALAAFIDTDLKRNLRRLGDFAVPEARERLLGVWGVGRETADSILNYGLSMPVFVVDAYTRRIFGRLRWIEPGADYDELRALFEKALPRDPVRYGEFHALVVRHGVELCANKPKRCGECPFEGKCRYEGKNERAG